MKTVLRRLKSSQGSVLPLRRNLILNSSRSSFLLPKTPQATINFQVRSFIKSQLAFNLSTKSVSESVDIQNVEPASVATGTTSDKASSRMANERSSLFAQTSKFPETKSKEDSPNTKRQKLLSDENLFRSLVLGGKYIDKTKFIKAVDKIYERKRSIVSFRPRRFGKSLVISMLRNYYDIKGDKEIFENLEIGTEGPRLNHYLVLDFDLSDVKTETFEAFQRSLSSRLNTKMARFQEYYSKELEKHTFKIDEEDALNTLDNLQNAVDIAGYTLFILVDEYDASINNALSNELLFRTLKVNKNNEEQNFSDGKGESSSFGPVKTIEQVESVYKTLFSSFKKFGQTYGTNIFITGVTPLALSNFTSGFNNAEDISLDLEFNELYGFTEAEVRSQLEDFLDKTEFKEVIEGILRDFKEKHNGYIFTPVTFVDDVIDGKIIEIPFPRQSVYNPERIKHDIVRIKDNYDRKLKTRLNIYKENKSLFLRRLMQYSQDPNTKPAEYILKLVANNPTFKIVAHDLLGGQTSTNQPSLSKGKAMISESFQERFEISSLMDLINTADSLISFLYYHGALTHSAMETNCFVIPNLIARQEYMDRVLEMLQWQKNDLYDLRSAIIQLVEKEDISPLCNSVDKIALSKLHGQNVVGHKEEGLATTFYDAFFYTLASHNIYPEHTCKRVGDWDFVIDFAILTPHKRIFIEFKNISMDMIWAGLNGYQMNKGTRWNIYEKESETIYQEQNETAILGMKLHTWCSNGMTVGEFLENSQKAIEKKYVEKLLGDPKPVVFLVLRVGLRKLLFRKLTEC